MLTSLLLSAATLQAEPYVEKLPNVTAEFKMVPVPGGTVKIADQMVEVKPFFMATTETTWDVFDQFLLSGDPSPKYDQTEFPPDAIARPSRSYILPDLGWGHKGYPVINVSSETVEMFCRWLRSVTKKKYRVPTEAEWQLASEADDWKADFDNKAWHYDNADDTTHPVGKKLANSLGLYDLFGNVGEWATDLKGKPVLCGGTLDDDPGDVTPFRRQYYHIDWQVTDPQLPKSRWWLSDGFFVGIRLVCER